jgi:DMSO/TMAO reductase YedYZ molybdopterin-dependent catalytic subunit
LNLTYEEFLALPNISLIATLQCVEGVSGTAKWQGVLISDLLDLAQSISSAFDIVF